MDNLDAPKAAPATLKSPKSPTAGLKAFTATICAPPSDKPCLTLVKPVLQEVGKLAAGVAAVATIAAPPPPGAASSGSATGNPRNKCALQPGHSLMDWIRLGASGKDLTGVGSKAGKLTVSDRELATHCEEDDAWIAIRGKVFNITEYLPFHPGGIPELMRGAGRDATQLFNEVHPWVNYESILQKCFIGRLSNLDSSEDVDSLFQGLSPSKSPPDPNDLRKAVLTKSLSGGASISPVKSPPPADQQANTNSLSPSPSPSSTQSKKTQVEMPRFDWIQKCESITIIFYTKAFNNAQIHIVKPNDQNELVVEIKYDHVTYSNKVKLVQSVLWPCDVVSNGETGKIEVVFKKTEGEIWKNYGVLQQKYCDDKDMHEGFRMKYKVSKNVALNYNTNAIYLESIEDDILLVPLGHHLRMFKSSDMSKSYTPVPIDFLEKKIDNPFSKLLLVIKSYPDGNVSKYATALKQGDSVELSKPIDPMFKLADLERRELFLLIAAGVGITPMIGLIYFLLGRRQRRCQKLTLLYFNRTESDILFRDQFSRLQSSDERFRIVNVLSQPDAPWTGPKGHVSPHLVQTEIDHHWVETRLTKNDLYVAVCGPDGFVNLAQKILKTDLGIKEEQVFAFLG